MKARVISTSSPSLHLVPFVIAPGDVGGRSHTNALLRFSATKMGVTSMAAGAACDDEERERCPHQSACA